MGCVCGAAGRRGEVGAFSGPEGRWPGRVVLPSAHTAVVQSPQPAGLFSFSDPGRKEGRQEGRKEGRRKAHLLQHFCPSRVQLLFSFNSTHVANLVRNGKLARKAESGRSIAPGLGT